MSVLELKGEQSCGGKTEPCVTNLTALLILGVVCRKPTSTVHSLSIRLSRQTTRQTDGQTDGRTDRQSCLAFGRRRLCVGSPYKEARFRSPSVCVHWVTVPARSAIAGRRGSLRARSRLAAPVPWRPDAPLVSAL